MCVIEPLIPRHRLVPTPSYKTLEKLGLFPTGGLIERGNRDTRAVESATQGGNKYMSSKEMYRHLNRIQELVPDDVRHHQPITFCELSYLLRATRDLPCTSRPYYSAHQPCSRAT